MAKAQGWVTLTRNGYSASLTGSSTLIQAGMVNRLNRELSCLTFPNSP